MSTVGLHARIDPELKKALDRFCKRNDVKQNAVVVEALSGFIGFEGVPSTPERVNALEVFSRRVERRLKALEDNAGIVAPNPAGRPRNDA